MDGREVSRRKALGLGGIGILGATFTGSTLLRGDAGPVYGARPPTRGQAWPPGMRPAGRMGVPAAAPPAVPPLPVLRKPAFKVQEIRPDAPDHAVALTIDDGPDPQWTPRVLDLLAHHEVKATFCLIGVQVRDHPELIRRMVAEGHEVANHTMRHPLLGRMSRRAIDEEVGGTHRLIHEITGVRPRLFRAPGGVWSRSVFKSVAAHGMVPIDWDVDPRDWTRPGVGHITRALERCRAGDILLCHDGGGDRSQTLASLRKVVPRLKERGLEFITL